MSVSFFCVVKTVSVSRPARYERRLGSQFLAQPRDVDVHGAFRHEGRILPDAVYQVLAAEDAGGIGGERRKDVEFGARQRRHGGR